MYVRQFLDYFVVLTRNCLASTLDYIVMQIRKTNREKGYCLKVLKKCQNKFDCLVNKMLLIKQLQPCLHVQSDSVWAKVFVSFMQITYLF